ncbi:SMI1/KNR4 family protein [Brevibacillus sp. HB1.1]|uniref:SMI1/KNR4 family protein n=1 Tax=Brevibacillus sp. HB1.1 TaxID=2738808 RepID=UPI00157612F7|nr:SMI1/KNR4 family protein [Brevibacillus sp. HB1.1]NTU33116.1 SMI1/KNR4 family protein [Brevibacillus sp. HB1.1]
MEFEGIIRKFRRNFERDGMAPEDIDKAFQQANTAHLHSLLEWVDLKTYTVPDSVVAFYEAYNPHYLPTLSGGIRLLNIESIKIENSSAVPSMYLLKFGLLTIATTIGGDAICLDLNSTNDSQLRVVIADQAFCSYNHDLKVVECVLVPDDIAEPYADDEPILLSYSLIKQCLPEIAPSFRAFLERLSHEAYETIEEGFLA